MLRRSCEHLRDGRLFEAFEKLTQIKVTRDQARGIEQYFMNENPNFMNVKDSIAATRTWREEAVAWAKHWAETNGIAVK